MKLHPIFIIAFTTISFFGFSSQNPTQIINSKNFSSIQKIPWIKNIGQYPSNVAFSAFCPGGKIAIDHAGNISYYLVDFEGKPIHFSENFNNEEHGTFNPIGIDQTITKVNVFKGRPDAHFSNISTYRSISYEELWPGISVKLQSGNENVEKIFQLSPGAESNNILIRLNDIEDLCIDQSGQLQVDHSFGSVYFSRPIAWQENENEKKEVEISYQINNEEDIFQYGFKLGEYDNENDLYIDPILSSTYLGGTNYETGHRIALDAQGKVFIAGNTLSADLPADPNAFDHITNGNYDAYVAKFSNDLSMLESCTFIGGSEREVFYDMAIDNNEHIVITGSTRSEEFPTTPGVYDNSYNGGAGNSITTSYGDIFITKLSNDLSVLESSTYIGGPNREWGTAILCDENNDIYITGKNTSELPRIGPQFYPDFRSAFFMKIDSELKTLLATNYVDIGSLYSGPHEMIFDHSGNIVVVGTISFLGELQTTPGCYDPTFNEGSQDVFVMKLSPNLAQNLGATFLGGNGKDYGLGVCVDLQNNIFVCGYTESNPFPVTIGAYDTEHNSNSTNNSDAFISKFNSELTSLLASSYLGGTGVDWWDGDDDSATDIIYDPLGFVYLCGHTESFYFPLSCESIDERQVSTDAFICKMDDNLSQLMASTLLGGYEYDAGADMIQNNNKELLITGTTYSGDFPDMNAYDQEYNEGGDAFVSKLTPDLINYTPCCTYAYPYDQIWANLDCSLNIMWEAAFKASGYYLSVGLSRESFDIIDRMDVGDVLNYDLIYLPNADTIYLKIDAYNEFGIAMGSRCFITSITTKAPQYYYEYQSICLGDTFYWEGFPMTEDGMYEVLHYASNGCDSIIHLDLEVLDCFHESVSMDICDGDSIEWFDQKYYTPGTYYKNFESKSGSNSSYQLILKDCENDQSINTEQNIFIYPNPVVNGMMHIEGHINPNTEISIYDSMGKQVMNSTKITKGTNINVSHLKNGLYFTSIESQGKQIVKQFILINP